MKLYVAGPMSGLPNLNYPSFHSAEEVLRRAGYDVLNPARVDEWEPAACGLCKKCKRCEERTQGWYMRRCIPMIMQSDGIAVLSGWHKSKGAVLEVDIGKCLDLPIATVQTFVLRSKAFLAGRDFT